MLAGGSPRGEIECIRELMPKAFIVAVDNDARCLESAIEAGADDVVCCDLASYSKRERQGKYTSRTPPDSIMSGGRFDIVHLDLCAGASPETRDMVSIYRQALAPGGVFIATFSYGRDVSEVFAAAAPVLRMVSAGVPDHIAGRIAYLFSPARIAQLDSIFLYRGASMPMCSVLLSSRRPSTPLSFVKVEAGDFELAVVYPSAARLYDCPADRIAALRRRFSAIKAVLARRSEELPPESASRCDAESPEH